MALISSSPIKTFMDLPDKITKGLEMKRSVDKAAQTFAELIYNEFTESVILSRLFLTVPFRRSPTLMSL